MAAGALVLTATFLLSATLVCGQRITTIQLDGVQYFISRMNPYSPELNYFLAYQYCRSLGLQLASFETQEKADSITQYLRNAGYNQYDFWTSGNALGTRMLIWMSSGLPFNATFNYMRKATNDLGETNDPNVKTTTFNHGISAVPVVSPVSARQRDDSSVGGGCVAMKSPELDWDVDDCTEPKDFICEQTRCYYYNYGSIPVSTSQGFKGKPSSTSETPVSVSQLNNSDPTASLINNNTVNRRVTLRPQESQPTTLPNLLSTFHQNAASTELPATFDEEEEEIDVNENIASRAFPAKDSATNVVYVTAISVDDGQKEESAVSSDNSSALAFEDETKF